MGFHNHLWKRGDVYHYRFMLGGQRYHGSTNCTGHEAAKAWLKVFRDGIVLGEAGIRKPSTLDALISEWESAVTGVFSPEHVERTRDQIRKHFHHMLSKSITKLTSEVVQEVITRYMATTGETVAKNGKVIKRPHTAGGAHALIRRLNGLMGYATKQLKMIKGAPYSVLLPTIQEEARPILVPSQVVPFLQVIDQQENPHVHLVVRLMLGLGLREGEARRAKWSWFRLDAGIYIGHGKTKKAKARPIPGWLEGYLRALPGDHKDGLLMPSKLVKDGQPCPHGAQFTTKPIRKAGIAVGVPKLSPQGIRATYGTILNKWAGATVTETQHLLGHGEASTTLNHYIQRYVPGLEDAQERFGEVTGLTKEHQFGNGEPEYQI